MSCLLGLLRAVAPEIEARLAPQVRGLFGGIVAGYLPQVWLFETDDGTVSIEVDRAGHVRAVAGALASPDVTIVTSHARLSAALATRRREAVPPGPLAVTAHTAKGRAALGMLRGRLGL